MQASIIHVQKWSQSETPSEETLWNLMEREGFAPFRWTNNPHDVYMAHDHPYHKIIYIISGSITFGFPTEGQPITLFPGDRLELPAHMLHNAAVGTDGVICLEAHRYI